MHINRPDNNSRHESNGDVFDVDAEYAKFCKEEDRKFNLGALVSLLLFLGFTFIILL